MFIQHFGTYKALWKYSIITSIEKVINLTDSETILLPTLHKLEL